jgi:uncharacterized protein YcbX
VINILVKVGTVKEIWRYPVKVMAGQPLKQCHLGKKGLAGDRIWALRAVLRQEYKAVSFAQNY